MNKLHKALVVIVASLLGVQGAYADTCGKSLTGLFTSFQAQKLCKTFGGSGSLVPSADNTYDVGSSSFGFRTGYFDTSVVTGLVSTTGDVVAGTLNKTVISSGGETAVPASVLSVGSAPRLYLSTQGNLINAFAMAAWGAASNGNNLNFYKTRAASSGAASTIVANNDIIANLDFYGANGTTYSNAARIAVTINGTPGATNDMPGRIDFLTSPDGSATPASVLSLDQAKAAVFTGTVTSSATGSLGWSVVNAANQACNTTCTSACVIGHDSASSAFLACTDATADSCLCAGAN